MATFYDYRYLIDGDKMVILQNNTSITDNPYLTENEVFLTPSASDSSAIYIQFTTTITAPSDENTDLGLPTTVERAILQHVKAQFAEDRGDHRAYLIHRQKFYRLLEQANKNLEGVDIAAPGANYAGAIR